MSVRAVLVAAVALGVLAALTTAEAAGLVVFGWVGFLARVLPRVTADGPSVAVGAAAVVLFAAFVHALGRASRGGRWRVNWTAAVTLGVVLLFAAGVAVVGIVHQVGWLAGSDRPLVGPGLRQHRSPETTARMMGLAMSDYQDTHGGVLPPGGSFAADGEMRHSWETHLLPALGYDARGIDLARPWYDPAHRPYFQSVVPDFINPGYRTPPLADGDGLGLSHYAANVRVLGANTAVRPDRLSNGASNTILVGEVNAGFRPWGHPVNWRDPGAGPPNTAAGFGGPPGAGGARFVMGDGSVRFVSDRASPEVRRGLSGP